MLACLPGPGDLPLQLHPHTQMNTGLQKWDTTQRMRSAPFPTPAELDAYAKKVANSPLTIKIFPNSVKVPQRNHVRRTVNGLDTSGQRYSPYPCAPARTGLLAIVRPSAAKAVLKDFDGSRARLHHEVLMNPPCGPYQVASTSTLNHPPPTPQQNLPQTLHMPLRHPPAMGQQGPPRLQTLPQQAGLGPPAALLHQPQRKPPDGDAPPNVTVSTSTIPLSMAGGVHQAPQADLSAIVHQLNQFCQTRGGGGTSMCEGQIANPSPISRNLLISACSRVSMHSNPPAPGFPPPGRVVGSHEKAHPHRNAPPVNHLPSSQADLKQQHIRSWGQHQAPHAAPIQNGGGHARDPAFHYKAVGYPGDVCVVGQPYSLKPPVERPTPSPPVNSSMPGPLNHYSNGHYFQSHIWNSSILPTPNSDSSGSQDVAMSFHAAPQSCTAVDCGPPGAAHYRLTGSTASSNLMQTADYMGGDFQTPYFRDQNLGLMGKMHRPLRVGPEVADGRTTLLQHPGYR